MVASSKVKALIIMAVRKVGVVFNPLKFRIETDVSGGRLHIRRTTFTVAEVRITAE
jgi:hypothetical protein